MKDFDRYDSAFRALSPRVQASPAGKAVADYIAAVRATQVGNTTPDFALEDIDGQMLRLSDLRGQYVLLDFWGPGAVDAGRRSPPWSLFMIS